MLGQMISQELSIVAHQQHQNCCFCNKPSQQICFIIKSAIIRLNRLCKKRNFSEQNIIVQKDHESINFDRFFRVLFGRNQFELKSSKFCSHSNLQNFLINKLRCKPYRIQSLVDQLCDLMVKRQYELQILLNQVKNIQDSIIGDQNLENIYKKASKTSGKSVKFIQKKDIFSPTKRSQKPLEDSSLKVAKINSIKIQDSATAKPFETGISPPTGISYLQNFQGIPLTYNLFFYERGLYQ